MHNSFNGRSIENIVAFDPGGTTGVCTYQTKSRLLQWSELKGENYHNNIYNFLSWNTPDVVVTERFDYRRRLGYSELISVEYIGVLRLWCQSFDRPLVEQAQLKGRSGLWTDDKLRDLSFYTTNSPHAMDALRQMLYFITVTLEDPHYVNKWKEAVEQ